MVWPIWATIIVTEMGDDHSAFRAAGGGLPVFGEPETPSQPGEGAFNYPTPGWHFEALGSVGPLEDLDSPLADPSEGGAQLDDEADHQAECVGDDVPFPALDLLPGVIAKDTAALSWS